MGWIRPRKAASSSEGGEVGDAAGPARRKAQAQERNRFMELLSDVPILGGDIEPSRRLPEEQDGETGIPDRPLVVRSLRAPGAVGLLPLQDEPGTLRIPRVIADPVDPHEHS